MGSNDESTVNFCLTNHPIEEDKRILPPFVIESNGGNSYNNDDYLEREEEEQALSIAVYRLILQHRDLQTSQEDLALALLQLQQDQQEQNQEWTNQFKYQDQCLLELRAANRQLIQQCQELLQTNGAFLRMLSVHNHGSTAAKKLRPNCYWKKFFQISRIFVSVTLLLLLLAVLIFDHDQRHFNGLHVFDVCFESTITMIKDVILQIPVAHWIATMYKYMIGFM